MADKKLEPADENKVGYGHPPVNSRFKTGRSGNPKGRPKGTSNFAADVKQMLSMPVPLERDGGRKRISTQQAGLLRLREKALKGDTKALDRMLELASHHNGGVAATVAGDQLTSDDQAILEAYLGRSRGEAAPLVDTQDINGKSSAEK
jgi:hypothetical protein